MKKKYLLSLILFVTIFQSAIFSQISDTLYSQARYYYENEEFERAITIFSEILINKPEDYTAFKYRGNCHMEAGNYDAAANDYFRALKIKPDYSDVYYNLGNVYEYKGKGDSAIYYFKKFISLEPELPEGYGRICLLYLSFFPELSDSAIHYAGKALQIDPENPDNTNLLATSFYSAGKYKSALETAILGLKIDSSHFLLNQIAGISSFFLLEYKPAITYFNKAFNSHPENYFILDYAVQAMLLDNTPSEKINFLPTGKFVFTDNPVTKIEDSEKQITSNSGIYNYKKNLSKFRNSPLSMSLDEMFMLYLGSTLQTDYAPYGKRYEAKDNEADFLIIASNLEEWLFDNPTDFPKYFHLANAYLELGNKDKFIENRYKYLGFIESIKAAGDGNGKETAFFVANISHEYEIMNYMGYQPVSQELITEKKHNYDILNGTDSNEKEVSVYFNIDKPFSTLQMKGRK